MGWLFQNLTEEFSVQDQIAEGLFLGQEEMPCEPCELSIGHYFLPDTLGRSEDEEAAARILSFSQEASCWMGVSWPHLQLMMMQDLRNRQEEDAWLQRRNAAWTAWENKVWWHSLYGWLSLGVYLLFAHRPPQPDIADPPGEDIFSGIWVCGGSHVISGIHSLLRKGMLKREIRIQYDKEVEVFFPTPLLVKHIMQKQGVKSRPYWSCIPPLVVWLAGFILQNISNFLNDRLKN